MFVTRDGAFIGYLLIADTIKEDAKPAVSALKEMNIATVMLTGDAKESAQAVADATVLACADVGAAMGSGADAAIEAADVVYMNSGMEAIPESLAIAQSTNRIAMETIIFTLIVKIVIMALSLCGLANLWAAIIADTAAAVLCVLNSTRLLFQKKN